MARNISGGKRDKFGKPMPAKTDFRPTRDDILRYVEENPDRAGKRDIAKAFSLKNEDRIWLKDLLRDLQDEGALKKSGKRLTRPGALPPVAVLDIFGRDADGNLLARPTETADANGEAPTVLIRVSRGGKAPGVGDRVLAKTFPSEAGAGFPYTARVMKVFEKRNEAVLGVFRTLKDGTFRIEPVERRQPELVVDSEFRGDAKGWRSRRSRGRRGRPLRPAARQSAVGSRLADQREGGLDDRHSCARHPSYFSGQRSRRGARRYPPSPRREWPDREDWRTLPLITIDPADAKDHDDAVYAEPDADEKNVGGTIVTVAIADVAAYVRSGSALDREALLRGNSVYFPDRVVPMLPERISNDLCSLKEAVDRPALAVKMTFDASGRKLRHTFHRIMMRSAAKLAYPQAQAAIDGQPDEPDRADPRYRPEAAMGGLRHPEARPGRSRAA